MSSVKQTFVVLETQDPIEVLIAASEYYAQPRELTVSMQRMQANERGEMAIMDADEVVTIEPLPKLTRGRALLLLSALYKEALSQYLYYRTWESPIETVAVALRDCAVPERVDLALAEEFISMDRVDSIVIDIHRQVGQFVGGNTWQQWELLQTPTMLALLGGQDYRITEWERAHGHEYGDGDDLTLSVNISTIVNYIRKQLVAFKGEHIASQIPIAPIIADAVQRRYPLVTFKKCKQVPYEQIQNLLGVNYEDFYQRFVKQVIDTFKTHFLLVKLDGSIPYRGEVTDKHNLVFYATQRPRNDEDRYFRDLKQSVDRGDWIPESERRRLQEHERRHPL